MSKLCVRPTTPTRREGEAFLRPLRKGRLAWAPPGLCTQPVAPLDGAALLESCAVCLGCAQPWAWRARTCQRPAADSLPAPSLGSTSLPPGTRKGKAWSLGVWQRQGPQKGRGPCRAPLPPSRAACLGRAAQARRARPRGFTPPSGCVPFRLQEPHLCVVIMTHTAQPVSGPLFVCTCEYNMIVQIQRRPSVCACARSVCACACVF